MVRRVGSVYLRLVNGLDRVVLLPSYGCLYLQVGVVVA